jgi:peptidyl-tRNA hydrolase|tara:strand:+ start:308 stop:454 length:147 start_codon:yes stop_codon:yes gene_type:complete
MTKDKDEVVKYILSNFELAEVDMIQEELLKHLNWYIETVNSQWENDYV